jgi:CAAX prenyl protease-like protein
MVVGSFEPAAPATAEKQTAVKSTGFAPAIPYSAYPVVYTIKIALTLGAIAIVWPGYRQFPFRFSVLAIVVGLIGAAVWIALAIFQREMIAGRLGWDFGLGKRSEFNPLAQFADRRAWAYGFLAIRFFGLVIVVPLIEEFFLRGFAMRFVMDADWWKVPFGNANRLAIVVGTLLPVLMHPQEAIAAATWFSAITWLMLRTQNIWDCVAAHAVTNLFLGVYVVASGNWWLM